MNDSPEPANESTQRRHVEYEDHHYHDDDELVPVDDIRPPNTRPPARRPPLRKLLSRRRRDIDDQ
jgi:hypothetical protein